MNSQELRREMGVFNQQAQALCRHAQTIVELAGPCSGQPAGLAQSLQALSALEVTLGQQRDMLQETLRQLEADYERYRKLFESTLDACFYTDLDGTIYDANQATSSLLKSPAQSLLGRPLAHYIALENADEIRNALILLKAQSWDSQQTLNVRLRTAEGEMRAVELRACVITSSVDGAAGVWWSCCDVTERVQTEQALQRQAALIDLSPDGIFVRRLQGTITFWSHGAELLYGWTRQEALGHLVQELLHTHYPQPLAEIVQHLRERGQWKGELIHYAKDGRRIVVESFWQAQFDVHGEVSELMESNVDITGRKQMEDTLRESEHRWATTLSSIGDAVIVSDTSGHITFMNAVAEALTGWTRQEAMARPAQEVFHIVNELTREPVEAPIAKVLATGMTQGLANHTSLVRRDGSDLPIDDSGSPVRDEDGRLLGAVLVFRDITERRKVERSLRQNRDQLDAILQSVADGITAQRPDGRMLYANDAAARQIGYASVQELLDAPPADLLARFEIYDKAGQRLDAQQLPGRIALRTGRSAEATVRYLIRASGEERWSIDKAVPIFDEEGRPEMAVSIVQDITDRVRADQALRGALTLTQELYATSNAIGLADTPEGLLRVLVDTRYLKGTTDALITIYDHPWTAGSAIPESVDILAAYTRPDLPQARFPVAGAHLPAPRMLIDELQLRTRPWLVGDVTREPRINPAERAGLAAYGICALAVFPLIANGVNFGVIAFYFDRAQTLSSEDMRHVQGLVDQVAVATANQLALKQEQNARREAERANELRLRFLGMISHELRTPLTSIKGFATTMLADDVTWDPSQQRDFIQTINQEADKLTDMIEQLLDLSRIESGSLRIEPRPQSLSAIVAGARARWNTPQMQHTLEVALPDNLPLVRVDAERISQVFNNLVSNAIKYAPAGTRIRISAAPAGNMLRVSVSDEGPGISAEDRQHVFEAFRRGDDGHTRRTKGAGLGLAICKGIVESHGGSIWIEDQPEPGATITFTLPIAH